MLTPIVSIPAPTPTPTPALTPVVITPVPTATPTPKRPTVVGDGKAPANLLKEDPAEDTPPEEKEPPAQLAGLLFLGGMGSMILGCFYVLFRQLRRMPRRRGQSRRGRKGR